MADLISKEQWLRLTDAGLARTRSSDLKRVDRALGEYELAQTPQNLDALRTALMTWIKTKGPGWKTDVRNNKGAIDTLYSQVMGVPAIAKTGRDMVALSHMRNESRAIVTDLFHDAELGWRPGYLASLSLKKSREKVQLAYSTVSTARDVNTLVKAAGGRGATSPEGAVESMSKALLPDDIAKDAWALLLSESPGFVRDFAVEVTPFIGVFASGGMAVYQGIKSLRVLYRIHEADEHLEHSLSTEDPRRAIEAMIRILERERNKTIAKFGIDSAAFGGKLVGLLVGDGVATNAAVGVASSAAKLSVYIHAFVRDFRERKAVNLMMKQPVIDGTKLFDVSPITGAYMVCCAPTSVMVNSIFDRFYDRGWRGDVEYAVAKHVKPLREEAARAVRMHRFWIPTLQSYPGLLKANKKKLKEMKERKGKSEMEGFARDDFWDWEENWKP